MPRCEVAAASGHVVRPGTRARWVWVAARCGALYRYASFAVLAFLV